MFCLANGSAITRPSSSNPILGAMAKSSALGIFFAGPFYIYKLGSDIPAIYPSIDLFLAPFLAEAAAIVDASLVEQHSDNGGDYPDALFFGSFAVLTSIGMFLAGAFLVCASTFKLANLGTYLPFSVLAGFFSAVGCLLWALAFSVDTGGKTWKEVLMSGDPQLILNSCLHHVPSLIVGILMNRLGPKNPFFVILLIVATLICFYGVMWITGTSIKEAQREQWLWSYEELAYDSDPTVGLKSWTLPPAPFGSFGALFAGTVNWTAVRAGLGNMAALAFLYLLRSSIHASAMKKNVGNLVRRIPIESNMVRQDEDDNDDFNFRETIVAGNKRRGTTHTMATNMFESVKESVRMVNMSLADKKPLHGEIAKAETTEQEYTEVRAKPSRSSLEEIFCQYGEALFVVTVTGGFGVCPTVATRYARICIQTKQLFYNELIHSSRFGSNTMYAIGAEGSAPQYLSIALLIIFYLTNFELVRYFPKVRD